MEGIETQPGQRDVVVSYVSVGAPTWRGLKLVGKPTCQISGLMSVGAPTWRGLKLSLLLLIVDIDNVSRCPDMEGIETPFNPHRINNYLCQ